MFYYPAVLKRHTGCFSTIWLVATKGIRVTRRDFLKVNVIRTCDDIMNYLLVQVPPPQPGLPRPRFSLYLSSQLQYGVILVYHRQCAILLEELQSIVGQLVKQRTAQKIDMDEQSRHALDFPDALSLLEEAEGAPDPLFGVMSMQEAMPSPNTLIQMGQEYLRGASPEHPELTPPTAAAAGASDVTASPDTITLRETEPVAIPVAEYEGEELVDHHPDTIDLLMAQTDHFPEGDLELPREEVAPGEQDIEMERGEGTEDLEKDRTKDVTGSTIELQPTTLSSEDAMLLPQEEPGLSVEKPGPPSDQLTPVSMPAPPSPPSEAEEWQRPAPQAEDVPPPEVETRRRRRRRKRQLIFFDPETQISQKVLQQQIDDPLAETRPVVLPPPSSHRMPTAAELFNNPCTFLPEEVLFLWGRAATITPVSGSDLQVGERGPESTDSEKEREREMVEAAEVAEAAEAAAREGESLELPREAPRDEAELMFEISDHGSLPLEGSDQRELSREIISPLQPSEKEGSTVSRSVSVLQDIPEMVDELPERSPAESPGLLLDFLEHEEAPVLFLSLLPPEVDRRTVSNIFQRLLGTLSTRKIRAEQDEPYGDIWISPGPNYEEVHQTL
ncbi:meiotic recombination protein REC8 homolog [Epinephelus fuscoguttatus]|uniref:meiotic recombination protein REC8 homolog n=1 Tax=Epinephelus fuscoguttatus TaxID=293821 RepID=UPI0020D1902E|nr:meiotic recombination protein REC8 homolog [Epinephelus fuscoguttatus]